MRTFIALDLDDEVRQRILRFKQEVSEFAPKARWIDEGSLHVTLKFIGEIADSKVKEIEAALGSVKAAWFKIKFGGTGFFPTARSARVFWIGIGAEPALANLATKVEHSLARLGIPKESRKFSPHLTLARTRGGSGAPGWRKADKPNRQFAVLQQHLEKSQAVEFGTMTAREFFLYRSQLSSKGSRYTKIARFGLE